MVKNKSRTRLLAIVLALVAIASIVALSLSLRAHADEVVTKYNVYLAADKSTALSFANTSEDTGFEGTDFVDNYNQFVSTNTKDAFAALTRIAQEIKNAGKVELNIWVLNDTTNGIASSDEVENLYVFADDNTRIEDQNGADIPVRVTGVTGYGSTQNPKVTSVTQKKTKDKTEYESTSYAYFGKSIVLKNITVELTSATQIFCLGHEFVADTGVQINGNGTKLKRLIASAYYNLAASEADGCYNGAGEYGKYTANSFAGKITVRSGNWDNITVASGHPGVGRVYNSSGSGNAANAIYDFSDTKLADYTINVEGDAAVKALNISNDDGARFVGGPNCSITFNVTGLVETINGGAYYNSAVTVTEPNATNKVSAADNSRQYYNLTINIDDPAVIGCIYIRNNMPKYATSNGNATLTSPMLFFGDITLNLKGGTFDMGSSKLTARGLGSSTGETNIRMIQGHTTPKITSTVVFLGKLKLTVGDPSDSSKGPKIGPTSNSTQLTGNHFTGAFYGTIGLGTGTENVSSTIVTKNKDDTTTTTVYNAPLTGSYANETIYKDKTWIKAPGNNPTMLEYAKANAGFEFVMYGGSVQSFELPLCAENSQGTKVSILGGTISTLSYAKAFHDGDGYCAGLNVEVAKDGVLDKYTCPTFAITGNSSFTVGTAGNTDTTKPDGVITSVPNVVNAAHTGDLKVTVQGNGKIETLSAVTSKDFTGKIDFVMKDNGSVDTLTAVRGSGTHNGDLNFTMQDSAKVGTLEGVLNAKAGATAPAVVMGDMNITVKDNAQITDLVTFMRTKDSSNTACVGSAADWAEQKKHNITIKIEGKALVQREAPEGCTNDYPGGISFLGYNEKSTAGVVTTCYGDYTLEMNGGTVRTVSPGGSSYFAIFLTGWAPRIHGDVNQTLRGGATVEVTLKEGATGGKSSGVFLAGSSIIFHGDHNIVLEDVTFSSYMSTSVGMLSKTTTGFSNGTRSVTLGSKDDENACPKFENKGNVSLHGGYSAVNLGYGKTGRSVPSANSKDAAITNTIYNVKTTGDLYLAPSSGRLANYTTIYSVVKGGVKTTISGGTFGGAVYAMGSTGGIFGDAETTITGGSFGSIYIHQTRGTATYNIDLTNATAKTIDNSGQKNRDMKATGDVIDYSARGDMVINLTNIGDTTNFKAVSGSYTGDITVNMIGGTTKAATDFSVVWGKAAPGTKVTGNVTLTATGVTFPKTVFLAGDVSNVAEVTGNITTTLTDCKVSGGIYGGGGTATVGGNVTTTLLRTTVTGTYYGGVQKGGVGGRITNTLTDSTLTSFYGGNGGALDHTVTVGKGIVNKLTDIKVSYNSKEGTFSCGSQYGIVDKSSESDYAIHTTIIGYEGNAGIFAGTVQAQVNGSVYLDGTNVVPDDGRHFVVGNRGSAYTLNGESLPRQIVGNVEVTLHSGKVGSVYLCNRSNFDASINDTRDAVTGDVTFNLKGGSIGGIFKGWDATHPSNNGGDCIVNIYTTENDVTLRGSLPVYNSSSEKNVSINLIAGDYTLYKDHATSTLTVDTLNTEGGKLKFATTQKNWNNKGTAHLTIKDTNVQDKVEVIRNGSATLKSEVKDGSTVWTQLDYAIVGESFSRSIQLGDTYAVRYLLTKEQIDFLGDWTEATVTYTVKVDGKTFKEGTATLRDGDAVEDSNGEKPYQNYYFFLVEGIFAKDYAKAEITVTVTLGEYTGTLENDTVEQALDGLGSEVGYKELADAITSYAKALEAFFYNGEDDYTVTLSEKAKEWSEATLAKDQATQDAIGLGNNGITAYGVNLITKDTLSIKFWLKGDKNDPINDALKATVTGYGGSETIDVEKNFTKDNEFTGFYTVTYECGAGDLATMLTMKLEGASEEQVFKACPLSYAASLESIGYSGLGNAIIEYAYWVTNTLVNPIVAD